MVTRNRGILLLLFWVVAVVTSMGLVQEAHAKNYRGPFQGRVVDAETQAPIEGAAVFVEWHIRHMGAMDTFYDSAEVLTDANGAFSIASKWSWNPWTNVVLDSSFIIFESGYGSVRRHWWPIKEAEQILKDLSPEARENHDIRCFEAFGDARYILDCLSPEERQQRETHAHFDIRIVDGGPIFFLRELMTAGERWKNMSGLGLTSDIPDVKQILLTEEIKREENSLRTRTNDE